MQCYFAPFTRLTDYSVTKNESLTFLQYGQRTRIEHEYVQVFCENANQSQIYVDYHSFFPPSPLTPKSEEGKFNVMIIGIDSVSKLNFHRMFNATSKTLKELGAIEFHGYNKVDDNTYPNLIPMLSGLSSQELNSSCLMSNVTTFDNCHFIWDDFRKKGYETLFSEDSAALGLFNYFRHGFDKQPTDYYFRTALYEMEKKIAYNKIGNYKLCLGHRTPADIFFKGYMQKFVRSLKNQSTFSFFWTSSMSHDYINYPILIDDDVSDLLNLMKSEKMLEKTVVFMMADHGIRFGTFRQGTFQGMVEERLRKD
jgi:membrane-anchored protein YejM (alkaline phosphatase superfamily)